MPGLDLEFVRAQFPALREHWPDWALMDNAGGSLAPRQVGERIADYLGRYMVQVGASYPASRAATEMLRAGHAAAELLINAAPGEVVLSSSTTQNAKTLALALRAQWQPGDRVIVSELDHEANVGCWRQLAATGIDVVTWPIHRETASLRAEELEPLLNSRTRLVTFTHCANVVGRIHDVATISAQAHAAGAQVCVDGVAYAPHRLVDVQALGVDYYMLSLYKVYGPHMGLLWGKREHLLRAKGQNHFFIAEDDVPYKLEPGNVNHELCASLPGIIDYLRAIDAHHHGPSLEAANHAGAANSAGAANNTGTRNLAFAESAPADRAALERCFELLTSHEAALAGRLLEFLNDHPKVEVIGPSEADPDTRVPTIAFHVPGRHASELPALLDEHKLAIRWGDFYAREAIDAFGLREAGGVVRVSMVHYNTLDEVNRLIAALAEVL